MDGPVAVLDHHRVLAASAEARHAGVRTGDRRREAEASCPEITILDVDPADEARVFEPVARAVESITPRVVLDRPGVLSFPTRGPSRYHGGDGGLADRIRDAVGTAGIVDLRIGIADGGFAARLAARRSVIVPAGETPTFLAAWPVGALGDEPLADLLTRLGLRTLGAFAGLPASAVLARLGREGLTAHRLARGEDAHPPALTTPPPDFEESVELDPPADRVDAVAFVAKGLADRLLDRLAARGLACTQVVVEVESEYGEHLSRAWRHEGALTSGALAERVRWQLDGWIQQPGGLSSGVVLLRLTPDEVCSDDGNQLGFWGGRSEADEWAARAVARVAGLIGEQQVFVPAWRGGRQPSDTYAWVSVDQADVTEPTERLAVADVPWPGHLPAPSPATVMPEAVPAEVFDAAGRVVRVNGRGALSADPAAVSVQGREAESITAWAGPWPIDERWWDTQQHRRMARFQFTTDRGSALLAVVERQQWWVTAVYS